MGSRSIKARKKAKRRAHKKTPEEKQAILQRQLHDAVVRRAQYGH